MIARGLSAFDPESVAIAAGRVMITRLHELAAQRVSFAFETTLSSRTFAPWLRDLRAAAYEIELLFLWLPSARGHPQEPLEPLESPRPQKRPRRFAVFERCSTRATPVRESVFDIRVAAGLQAGQATG